MHYMSTPRKVDNGICRAKDSRQHGVGTAPADMANPEIAGLLADDRSIYTLPDAGSHLPARFCELATEMPPDETICSGDDNVLL
jgi:hypothetical protein